MSYDCPDFVDDVVNLADSYGITDTRENEDDDSLRDLLVRVETAFVQRKELVEALDRLIALIKVSAEDFSDSPGIIRADHVAVVNARAALAKAGAA